MERKLLTLAIVQKGSHILLGMKKRGFGQGRWNGFGGKVRDGETIEEAAKRELEEEAGVTAHELEPAGILEFEFSGKDEILEVHIFRVSQFSGAPTESEEMRPQWFAFSEIPYETMWADDKEWLPLFLDKRKFNGYILFDNEKSQGILDSKISIQE